jgi:hypothetical protein
VGAAIGCGVEISVVADGSGCVVAGDAGSGGMVVGGTNPAAAVGTSLDGGVVGAGSGALGAGVLALGGDAAGCASTGAGRTGRGVAPGPVTVVDTPPADTSAPPALVSTVPEIVTTVVSPVGETVTYESDPARTTEAIPALRTS